MSLQTPDRSRPYKIELTTVQFCYVYFQKMKYKVCTTILFKYTIKSRVKARVPKNGPMNLGELEERGLFMQAPRVLHKNYFLATRPYKIKLTSSRV